MTGSEAEARPAAPPTPKPGEPPLRIAVVTNALPGPGRNAGGVAQVADDLARGLGGRGHAVTVWSYDEGDPGETGRPYLVRRLPGRAFAATRVGRFLTEGYLGNVFGAVAPFGPVDAIVTMGDSLLMPLRGRPLIRVMHGSALQEALSARSPARIVAQVGIYAQELLTGMTQRGCVGVSENSRRHNPFVRHVIPNGTDLSTFRPAPEGKTAHPSILFVGTLEGRKRGQLLLDWFRDVVRPALPAATLTMVGPSGDPGVPGVGFVRGISKEALADLYRRAWVYASPSAYEGFGLPYIEAMASGTAVLATPNPGSREVLDDGRFGCLASDERFADALVELLGDAERRDRMAAAGIGRAAEYSLERTIDRYEALIQLMVRQRRGRGGGSGR